VDLFGVRLGSVDFFGVHFVGVRFIRVRLGRLDGRGVMAAALGFLVASRAGVAGGRGLIS